MLSDVGKRLARTGLGPMVRLNFENRSSENAVLRTIKLSQTQYTNQR